jgi:hypothetical protein
LRIANTKKEANNYYEISTRFEYNKDLLNTLYKFHTDIGATKELPTEKEALKKYLVRLHETLMVKNPLFGDDIPFIEVYPKWLMAVIYDEAKRYGNNISALAKCFNDWYKLNAGVFLQHKELSTKEIAQTSLESWPDKTIIEQYKIITKINNNSTDFGLFGTKNAKSYFNRIQKEFQRRYETKKA